jgi:hypothetical protein
MTPNANLSGARRETIDIPPLVALGFPLAVRRDGRRLASGDWPLAVLDAIALEAAVPAGTTWD